MNKIIKWLICKDIKEDTNNKQKEVDNYQPGGQVGSVGIGIKILTKNIIDLNGSTNRYSRILIILTMVIAFLTVIMVFRR